MTKKIITGLFVCMFVFAFSFVSVSVSEEYSGTAKIKAKFMGLDEGKERAKEKCTICMDIDDEDGDVHGMMVCGEGSEDETEFELGGIAGDQAFFIYAWADEVDEYIELEIVGKVKEKSGKVGLKGIFVGCEGGYEGPPDGVLQGKMKAKLALGECIPQ